MDTGNRRAWLTLAGLALVMSGCSASDGSREGEDASVDGLEDAVELVDDVEDEEAFDPDAYTWPGFETDADRILADIEFLASDALQGRDTGSEGNELALQYVEELFEELELVPAGDDGTYRQSFTYERWSLDSPLRLAIGGTELRSAIDYDVMRYSGPADTSGPLVFVGYGLVVPPYDPAEYPDCPIPETGYDDWAGIDADGAVVLMYDGVPGATDPYTPPDCPFESPYAQAVDRGATAMLRLPAAGMPPDLLHGATISLTPMLTDIPFLQVDTAAMDALIPELSTWHSEILDTMQPSSHATGLVATVLVDTSLTTYTAQNVVGAIEGVDPGSGLIFNGADDNASGTAVVMEMARAVALGVIHPRRTMVFALWNAEEHGLLGSCAYVDDPPYPIEDTVATINLDTVGDGAPGLILPGAGQEGNLWMYEFLMDAFLDSGLDGSIMLMEEYLFSDHACFAEEGVPYAFLYSTGDHCCVHTAEDTAENMDPEVLGFTARMTWSLTEALATGTEG